MPDWKALGDEAVEITRQYLRIDTTNPPGNETPAAEFLAGDPRRGRVRDHDARERPRPGEPDRPAPGTGPRPRRSTRQPGYRLANHVPPTPGCFSTMVNGTPAALSLMPANRPASPQPITMTGNSLRCSGVDARGIALHQATMIIPYYRESNPAFTALAERTVEQLTQA